MGSSEIVDLALKILSKYPLCDYCLGRHFASIGYGISNKERGRTLKTMLFMEAHRLARDNLEEGVRRLRMLSTCGYNPASKFLEKMGYNKPESKPCYICGDALNPKRFIEISSKIAEQLKEYEFRDFLVGAKVPVEVREREDAIYSEYMITTGEDIKEDITREIGLLIQKELGRDIEYKTPEIVILVDIFSEVFEIQVNPLFIYGRYRKLRKDIPQTPWLCRECWGRGCIKCNYSGREYPESISELIGGPAVEYFEAVDFKFHGAGREDVDAVVLGSGRPFVLELKHPRKRFLELKILEEKINREAAGKIEVQDLRYSSRRELRILKTSSPLVSKTYEATVEFENEVDEENLRKITTDMNNIVVEQWTPTRVLKRRADKLRRKKLYYVEAEKIGPKIVKFRIKAQGGLYVKELIDGDNGRTRPNVMELLGNKPIMIQLSVLDVENIEEN
ncbi:MAG: tRNA pseudouridine(54/55) synthase Pus10 [Nitrososphaerota archaeon]